MVLQKLGVKKSEKNIGQDKGSKAKGNNSPSLKSVKSKNIGGSVGKKKTKKKSIKMKKGSGFSVSKLE